MKCMYNLDDVYCKEQARASVIKEIIKILESSDEKSLDIAKLFDNAKKSILKNICTNYFNNSYQIHNVSFIDKPVSAFRLDERIRHKVEIYNNLKKTKQKNKNKINEKSYSSFAVYEAKENIKDIEEVEKRLELMFKEDEEILSYYLSINVPIESIIFKKLENGKYVIEDWIKPYLNKITFNNFPITRINIKNYDFTGTNGIIIPSRYIYGSLSNTVLNGTTIKCYSNSFLHAIDPTKVDITGTNFTGSKGAVVTLENVDKLPKKCNLTDAKIVVNSKEDIKKLNLKKYKENIYIKQDGVIEEDRFIDCDLKDFLNYTGTIDDIKIKSINEALILEGYNNEEIRIEDNKIASYIIASEIASIIDFEKLYRDFEIIKEVKNELEENPIFLKEVKNYSKNDRNRTQDQISIIINVLQGIYETKGNPLKDDLKYTISDDKFKAHTYNGVLTVDFLRLGLQKEGKIIFKKEKELNLGDSTNSKLLEFFTKIYNNFLEIRYEDKESINNNEENKAFENTNNYLFINNKIINCFKESTIKELEDLVYNSLEENNKGYSYAIKKS